MSVPTRHLAALRLAAQGYTVPQIARRMGISESVTKYHLEGVRARLGARNTAHAVAIAFTAGLITLDASREIPIDFALSRIADALGYTLQIPVEVKP
jgi:DNA-binding CsgD family transcriptional regulator